jgi:hypothetical protein
VTASFTNTAENTIFTVTLPSGMFLAGKVVRVRCGGTFLANSGTACTYTFRIKYGATTLFGDVSLAVAADADRGAWWTSFDLTAQANADQALSGFITMANTPAGRIPGSVAGTGDILGSVAVAGRPVTTPFSGAAAIDSDAGDNALVVTWQLSVNNAALDIIVESATAELL